MYKLVKSFKMLQIPLAASLWCALVGYSFAQTAALPVQNTAITAVPADQKVLLLEATVNGEAAGTWTFLESAGSLYVPREAFAEWRVTLRPEVKSIFYKELEFAPLMAVPGFESNIDTNTQTVAINFAASSFSATRLVKTADARVAVSSVLPSAFFNYDLNYSASSVKNSPNVKDLGLLSELGASNEWGVLTTSQAGRNLTNDERLGASRNWVRLETTFTKNFLENNTTLRLGDTATQAGQWGRRVYFGGVQYGTNYGLTPNFVSQPIPIISGVSSAPSTVEMYVNGVLRQTSSVPTGPFTIDNLPQLSAGGEAKLVVRDLLGRETIITQPFFTNSQLLAEGLNDWSLEAGRVRKNLGTSSSEYGDNFASGTWRRGLTNRFTFEGRAEATPDIKTIGASAMVALPAQALARASLVSSNSTQIGTGRMWVLGLEKQGLNFGSYLRAQGATASFRQLGQELTTPPVKLQVAGSVNYSTKDAGTFGLGFARITSYDQPQTTTISANYSTRVGKDSNLSISAAKVNTAGTASSGAAVNFSFTIPLERSESTTGSTLISSTANHADNSDDFAISATHSAEAENGVDWRVSAGLQNSNPRAEGGVAYSGRYGRVTSDISASRDQSAVRFGATGGAVVADGHFFATKRVDNSFGIAEVAGYPNIGIGLGGNSMTKTNADGIALIPRLMPFQNNAIRIDPTELPISAEIDSIEQFAVPAYRSAVKVIFPVRSGRGALIKINLADGFPAPAGAIIYLGQEKQEFYVARRGEAFVTGLQPTNRLTLNWNGKSCQFDVTLPAATDDDIARVGPVTCEGVTR
jgi:outer membrane usher protein